MSASPRPSDEPRKPVTLTSLGGMRALGEPIVMVTAYDHPSAQVAEAAGVDMVLVGDSAAMTVSPRCTRRAAAPLTLISPEPRSPAIV